MEIDHPRRKLTVLVDGLFRKVPAWKSISPTVHNLSPMHVSGSQSCLFDDSNTCFVAIVVQAIHAWCSCLTAGFGLMLT